MKLQLEGKRAIVTGSTSGIGEGIAKELAREGAYVVVQGRNEKEAKRVADEIALEGGKAVIAIGDLNHDKDAEFVFRTAMNSLGGVDILVNNAGIFLDRNWDNTTPQDWLDIYNTNVVSMVRMVNVVLPELKKNGWGRLIQIASVAGFQGFDRMADYGATKSSNILLTHSLAKTLAGTGVTANTVSPGPVATKGFHDMMARLAKKHGWTGNMDEIEKRVATEVWPIPAGRVGRVEEIATAVTYLASPLADYINGANLRIDGGFSSSVN
jgi:3-oxoacyl-[acyl-carrier protein] reductase